MTNEELNTALYEKMFAEQETYRAWLLSQPFSDVFADWKKKETDYMYDIWQTEENRAKAKVQKYKKKDEKQR